MAVDQGGAEGHDARPARACARRLPDAAGVESAVVAHPLVLALFANPSSAAAAARDLRALGVARERVSIVARSHDEEGDLAQQAGASPGSEIEDSRPASRLGELSA